MKFENVRMQINRRVIQTYFNMLILLWLPVSIVSLYEDNLSCEITFLYLEVSSMSRYIDLSIIVLKSNS